VSDILLTPLESGRSSDPGPRGRLALLVADAVNAVARVRLTGGSGVEIVTQYSGGRAVGVHLSPGEVTVCLIVEDVRVKAAADAVHLSVSGALQLAGERRRVKVIVADIDLDAALERA
jgi:hypothetical protein